MKFRYIFTALLLLAAASCQQPEIESYSEIQVSDSYVSISVDGGSTALDLTTTDAWDVDATTVPEWLTVAPMSGAAGSAKVNFSAAATKTTNKAEVKFNCGNKTQYVNVIQYAAKADPVTLSVAEALAVIKPLADKEVADGIYRVKGIVCEITEISPAYGNATYYISDDGTKVGSTKDDCNWLQVYRGLWLNGDAFKTGNEFALGDELVIEGALMDYHGTPETQEKNSYVISLKKSLISVTPNEFEVDKDGGDVLAKVLYSGDGLEFSSDCDWLTVCSMNKVKDTTMVTIHAAPNTADARRGVISLSSSKGSDSSMVTVTVSQAAGFSAFPLPYEASFLGDKASWELVDVIPVDGVAAIWVNDAKYGMKATATKKVVAQAELISPNIDLSAVSSAVLSFEHVSRYAASVWQELKLFVSIDNGENWEELLIPVYSSGKDWNYVSSTDISLKKFAGNLVRIKFQYNSNENAYATWELKNLKIVEGNPAITNIAGLIDDTVAAEAAFTGNFTDAVVTYVNGNNAFIEDATGGIQLYKSGHGLTAGMVINGAVSGKVKLYNGYAELTDVDGSKATVTTGSAPAPTVMTLATLLDSYLRWQNCQVKLEGVTFTKALDANNRNGEISQGGKTIAAYSQVKGKVLMDGTGNLVCFPTRYNATLQVGCWDSAHFTK
jgi:hypothetical protein